MKYFILIYLLASCCNIDKGKIIEKRHRLPYSYNYTEIQHCGKTLIPIPRIGYKKDTYFFTIINDGKIEDIEIEKKIYDLYNLNEWFNKDSIKIK